MNREFPITIENRHVIKREQAKISIMTTGINGCELNFAHKFRDFERPIFDLGETLSKNNLTTFSQNM